MYSKLSVARFAWNFHGSHEATNHVTSYRYDTTRTERKDPSVLELWEQTLHLREYPHDATDITEHPFYSLVTAVRTPAELHNNLALMEASYALIRIVQNFPNIRIASGVLNEPVGAERQRYTIGVYPMDGVHVDLY